VRELLQGRCEVELGDPGGLTGPKVAVVAHWSRKPVVSRSVNVLLQELQAAGYQAVVSSTSSVTQPLAFGPQVDTSELVVIRRPNVGYDFGSWSIALELVPGATSAQRTLLLNDSMAGPFSSLAPLLADFEASPVDVWGLTDTQQFGSHLQSYLLGFREGVLAERPIAAFWADIAHHDDKDAVIHQNEIGFSRLLQREGFVHAPAFPHERVVAAGQNPVIKGWKRLLDLGFPFLKREILRTPEVAPGGQHAPDALRRRFGVEVADWVDDLVAA
jgi:lipopolysaccharide biosynthesis protein